MVACRCPAGLAARQFTADHRHSQFQKRAVQVKYAAAGEPFSSWPGLTRPSTASRLNDESGIAPGDGKGLQEQCFLSLLRAYHHFSCRTRGWALRQVTARGPILIHIRPSSAPGTRATRARIVRARARSGCAIITAPRSRGRLKARWKVRSIHGDRTLTALTGGEPTSGNPS